MNYRSLGRTGLQVSEIGFGGAPAGLRNYLGKWEPAQPEAEDSIHEAIHTAIELGINYFDTAPGYGDGASERMFGCALKPFRSQLIVATKGFFTRRDDMLRSVETSLERLQVEWIDVMQIHGTWYSDEQAREILGPDGALEGLQRLRSQGLVRHLGFTTEGVNGAASQLIASGEFDVVQCCYNLIYQHPYDPVRKAGLMYEAKEKGMGIVTMRPLTSGIFQKWLGQVFGKEMQEKARQQRVHQSLLSFVLSNPMVDSVLVGMRTAAEVTEIVADCENRELRIDLGALHERFVS
jgi:aryl-alcohol dehydrogenase-like predicted oxidoreductase